MCRSHLRKIASGNFHGPAAMSHNSSLVSSDKILVFNGEFEEWDGYSNLAKSHVGPLLFILYLAELNPEHVRREGLDLYREWAEETNEKEFKIIEDTFAEEVKKEHGSSADQSKIPNPVFEFVPG